MNVQLRPVTAEDRELLIAIYASSRETEMAAVPWTPEQKSMFLTMQSGAQERHYRAQFPASEHSIVVAGGADAGRIWVDRGADATSILDMTVLPAYRAHGIGSTLIRELQAEGRPLTIYVDSFSPAVQWFERRGFVKTANESLHVVMRWTRDDSRSR